jgi:3-dehydroquinate dehydratase-2
MINLKRTNARPLQLHKLTKLFHIMHVCLYGILRERSFKFQVMPKLRDVGWPAHDKQCVRTRQRYTFTSAHRIFATFVSMKIQIINGPNLNLLGVREESIYGNRDFENYLDELRTKFPSLQLAYFQSNIEGELVGKIQEVGFSFDGILLNAGAYTHTSIALHDAIAAVPCPVIEVHISNIYAREEFRHKSIITSKCKGLVAGFGLESYALALTHFANRA